MSGLLATYEWGQLPWRKLEVAVFKLQRRIYRASQAGEIRRVHRLQRLLLKSRAAKLLAVRRVTQDNQGKHPGLSRRMAVLLKNQSGRCYACGLVFTSEARVEVHHLDGDHRHNQYRNLVAVHRHCHDQIHGGQHELSQLLGTRDKSSIN